MTVRVAKFRAACLTLSAALWAIGCGSSAPSPTPIQPPPPPPPNNPPIVHSITAEHARLEVKGITTLKAEVQDAETAVDALQYEWSAQAGTITGQGREVTYQAPESMETPAEPSITLTVVENYTVDDNPRANRTVFTTQPVRVHDSRAELTDLARTFLDDFIDSSVSPSECVRNFSDSCSKGKADELNDIKFNRDTYVMLPGSKYSIRTVTIRTPWAQAEVVARCEFHAKRISTGATGVGVGTCTLEAIYESDRWWLCESSYSELRGSSFFIRVF